MKSGRHGTRISLSWTPASRAAARCFTSLFTNLEPIPMGLPCIYLAHYGPGPLAAVKELTVEPEVSLVATSTRH